MDAETLNALQGSIKKWELIVSGEGTDLGSDNCPLCATLACCGDCPVDAITHNGCMGSPYGTWYFHHEDDHFEEEDVEDERGVLCPTCKELAQAELDFLKSLLPKE